MTNKFEASELILNHDKSVYHLGLLPEDISNHLITVGDPERVQQFKKFLSKVSLEKHRREFHSLRGIYKGVDMTILSTGIGTDNIDIVLNEIAILKKIDVRTLKSRIDSGKLKILRLGTSGGYADDVKLGDVLFTKMSVGLDGLANYYPIQYNDKELQLTSQLRNHLSDDFAFIQPYIIGMPWIEDDRLMTFAKPACTFTCQGFYNPQGRKLWQDGVSILDVLGRFNDGEHRLDNFEMETSGIYALSRYHGFSALSLSLILAHRKRKEFIDEVPKRMNEFLEQGLDYMALTENN